MDPASSAGRQINCASLLALYLQHPAFAGKTGEALAYQMNSDRFIPGNLVLPGDQRPAKSGSLDIPDGRCTPHSR